MKLEPVPYLSSSRSGCRNLHAGTLGCCGHAQRSRPGRTGQLQRNKAKAPAPRTGSVSVLEVLHKRFEDHMERHKGLSWSDVQGRLQANPQRLRCLEEMERTSGEPDVVGREGREYLFVDCSPQSPAGRRSLCYDQAAWQSRKEAKPGGSAVAMAKAMGIELLTEAQYRSLQELGAFDTTTSSWIETTPKVRELGGALFCDRRYDQVFVYHNGAESYYAARGFRGLLRV